MDVQPHFTPRTARGYPANFDTTPSNANILFHPGASRYLCIPRTAKTQLLATTIGSCNARNDGTHGRAQYVNYMISLSINAMLEACTTCALFRTYDLL